MRNKQLACQVFAKCLAGNTTVYGNWRGMHAPMDVIGGVQSSHQPHNQPLLVPKNINQQQLGSASPLLRLMHIVYMNYRASE
jgi:hypothetical protein